MKDTTKIKKAIERLRQEEEVRKICATVLAERKEEVRVRRLKAKYGFTEYPATPECEICGTKNFGNSSYGAGQFHVDHDHHSGEFRGFLCRHCNWMLGNAKDDIKILESAIKYLKKYQIKIIRRNLQNEHEGTIGKRNGNGPETA